MTEEMTLQPRQASQSDVPGFYRRLKDGVKPALPLELVHLSRRMSNPGDYRRLRGFRDWSIEEDDHSIVPFLESGTLFVHIPKCAGVSVMTSLFGCLGGGHTTLAEYQIVFDPGEYRSLWKFTFVRNPWDRLVSAYSFLREGGMNEDDRRRAAMSTDRFSSFEEFVREFIGKEDFARLVHFRPQHRFACLSDTAPPGVDFVGRFERLGEDFARVCEKMGREVTLASANRTKARPRDYRSHYDADTAAIVGRAYARDVELFGYSF